jgi:hypothetical protein
MRRLGLIDHVSRFNQKYGYREGWVFSNNFSIALNRLADLTMTLRERRHPSQERKDRDLFGLPLRKGSRRSRFHYRLPLYS